MSSLVYCDYQIVMLGSEAWGLGQQHQTTTCTNASVAVCADICLVQKLAC